MKRLVGFQYRADGLYCEGVRLADLAARYGTPLYVYSAGVIRDRYRRLSAAFAALRPRLYYAVKANANLSLLKLLKDEGAGFDVVSGGELARALAAGADPARVVFAGVGKTEAELTEALAARIGWFNAESADELARLNALASAAGRRPRVALRLNPDVEPDTHPHVRTGGGRSKFGFPLDETLSLLRSWDRFPALDLGGVHLHIGSQLADPAATLRALDVALDVIARDPRLTVLDLGGGFPVPYRESDAYPSIEAFAAPIVAKLGAWLGRLTFHLEPGRYLVAEAGALVTTVQAVKIMAGRRVVVVDTGLHHLLRPALYNAYHRVLPLARAAPAGVPADVVGPICESSDVLARERRLPELRPGEGLALMEAGAYGFSMASQYNAQVRPAEVLVTGEGARLIRRRETYAELMAPERECLDA